MIHLYDAFRGRELALFLENVDSKGKKRRPHGFRDKGDDAEVFRCPGRPGMTKGGDQPGMTKGGDQPGMTNV